MSKKWKERRDRARRQQEERARVVTDTIFEQSYRGRPIQMRESERVLCSFSRQRRCELHANPSDHSQRYANGRAIAQIDPESKIFYPMNNFFALHVSDDENLSDIRDDFMPGLHDIIAVNPEFERDDLCDWEKEDADDSMVICHNLDLKHYGAYKRSVRGLRILSWIHPDIRRKARRAFRRQAGRIAEVTQRLSHGRKKSVPVERRKRHIHIDPAAARESVLRCLGSIGGQPQAA